MKRMRKLVSIILVLSLCFTLGLSTTAYATSENLESPTSVYTFLDSEGKENSLEMTLLPEGQVKSTLYIEGAFIATTTAQYNTETDQIHINRVANAGPSINVTVPLSTYISSEYVSPLPSRSTANASYNKEGTIFYNPYYGENLSIEVFTAYLGSSSHYETFAAAAGTVIDVAVSTLGSYLYSIYPALFAFATPLLQAFLLAAGVTVVAGVIKDAVVQDYYVNDYVYNVKTKASDSGAEHIYYDNHAFEFELESNESGGDHWSERVRCDYLEWDDDGVATQFFCDFWGMGNCPGINYYIYV